MNSQLETEIKELPARLREAAKISLDAVAQAASSWERAKPVMLMTIARGTSDAAATYAAHLLTREAGVLVGSFQPSLASVHGFKPASEQGRMKALAISQSGASPDLIMGLSAFAQQDRWALTNVDGSELEEIAQVRIPVGAGPEHSVAATKSFACTLLQLQLLAAAIGEGAGPDAERCADAAASALERPVGLERLVEATSAYVIGRGATLAVAQEAAIKLKELSGLHAEAISAAEVMHGPKALAGSKLPVLAFAAAGRQGDYVRGAAAEMAKLGSPVIEVNAIEDEHAFLFAQLAAFYQAMPELARARGFDPDSPHSLTKVTRTT